MQLINVKNEVREMIGSDAKFELMSKYVDLVMTENKKYNLTRYDEEKFWTSGVYASLLFYQTLKFDSKYSMVDVGSGNGLPIIPYLIYNGDVKAAIIERAYTKVSFLNMVKEALELDVEIIEANVKWVRDKKFDIITAQALGSLDDLIWMTYHLTNINGISVFLKGEKVLDEIINAKELIMKRNIKINYEEVEGKFGIKLHIIWYAKS